MAPLRRQRPQSWSGLLSVVALALTCGCDPGQTTSEAGLPDGGPPPLTLTAETVGPLGLPFGSTSTIEVRLSDAMGMPRAAESLDFALEGSAADSSLSQLTATTGTDGIGSVELAAGDRPASFRVRANHPLASPIYIDVTVAASFGRLAVHPIYDGPRTVETWTVNLTREGDCPTAIAMPDLGSERVIGVPVGEARFDALATDVPYTVLIRAMGNGMVVASGCAMGVGVLADTTTVLDVPALSVPLTLSGLYEVQVTLDAAAATRAPLEAFVTSATASAGGAVGDADRMLSGLEATLAGNVAGTTALSRLRGAGAGAALASALGRDASAPSAQLPTLLSEAVAAAVDLRAEASLEVALGDVPTFSFRRLVADARSTTPLPLTLTSMPDAIFAATFAPASDSLSVDRLAIPLPLGEVLAAVVDAEWAAAGLTSSGELFGSSACTTLSAFVETDVALAAACDSSCRAAACTAALDATLALALTQTPVLDAARARLELTGALEVRDGDTDLGADTLNGALSGTYDAADGTENGPVTGVLSAARPLG